MALQPLAFLFIPRGFLLLRKLPVCELAVSVHFGAPTMTVREARLPIIALLPFAAAFTLPTFIS